MAASAFHFTCWSFRRSSRMGLYCSYLAVYSCCNLASIARGIYHMGDFVVLDEPTAAIDPMNEQSLYESFIRMMEGQIGLVVTHRLGLARCCTRIVLMKDGEIAAAGTHEELTHHPKRYFLRASGDTSQMIEKRRYCFPKYSLDLLRCGECHCTISGRKLAYKAPKAVLSALSYRFHYCQPGQGFHPFSA